jgi:hypothetical protein
MKSCLISISISFFALFASFQVQAQNLYEIKSLDFNTREFEEFAPVIYNNGLIFNSDHKKYLYKTEVDINEKGINDIYFVPKSEDGKWGIVQSFSNTLNSKYHEGKCTFTKDGSVIYFTRFEGDSTGYIYKANKSGSDWNNPMLISLDSKKYRIKDPCLSADGKKMYFASKAPDGFGGYDIYVSSFERGDWSTPRNLGPLVNTKGDEVAPFIHANGRLYFSSNKLPGLGKFDIFYTKENNGKWITPQHLSAPINSNRDDLYYCSDPGDTTGYFSSNRNRSFDIFSFKNLWPKPATCKPLQKNEYTYVFYEKGSVDTDTTTWLYEWDFGDGSKTRVKEAEANHTFEKTGQYVIQLNVIDTLTGETLLNEDTYPFTVENIEQAYITCPDTTSTGIETQFNASDTNLPKFKKIDYYFWEFGDKETSTGISAKHIYLTPGRYIVKLIVQSAPNENGKISTECTTKEIEVKPGD